MLSAERIATATPATRDRVVDLVRTASLLTVVAGHWLMADVVLMRGGVRAGNVLTSLPHLQPVTWVLQPVPLLFVTGGFANVVVWRRVRALGGSYAEYVAARLDRLVRPAVAFVLVGQGVLGALLLAGAPRQQVDLVGHVLGQPLWFLGVYVGVTALAPVMAWLHARVPRRALLGLAGGVVVVDVLRYRFGVERVGYLNVAFVWLFAQQVGFGYADGRWAAVSRRGLVAVAVAAFGSLAVLTGWGPYPVSMVGLPGQQSNMLPPTACLLALTVGQVSLVRLASPRLAAWLARPVPWARVVVLGALGLPVYLWHLSVLVAAFALVRSLGVGLPATGGVLWWVTRPVWLAVLAAALAVVVVPLSRVGARRRPRVGRHRPTAPAATGAFLVAAGLLGFVVSGLAPAGPWSSRLVGVPVDPVQNTVCLLAGLWLGSHRPPRADRDIAGAARRSRGTVSPWSTARHG